MRCFSCWVLSFTILCKKCENELFTIKMYTQKLGSLDVLSFFTYSALEPLLLTKHTPQGYRVFNYLGKKTLKPFVEEFLEADNRLIYVVGIDEVVKNGYSHVALLTHNMRHYYAKILHSSLLATNRVNYSGKNLEFRLHHPRKFVYKGKSKIDVILVDDIITTGITLQEAHTVLSQNGVNVLFALTLAYVEKN